MRDVLEYIRELFREARDDRFFSWIGSSFKYVFYIALVVFLVYQGYSMYTRSLEAKRMRFADAFVTLQHAFDEFVNEENNEEKRKKFLDNYANLSNAMEPYGTLATLYLALFYERTGQKDLVASTLLEHSQKVDSKFWNDLCFLVAQRFAVPIQCKQNSGLFGTRAFV
ncbi:MAG: hypothetical protein N2654_07620, partial [Deltaproteobacteria bacterium]|nr:hypothetical protein [Deltaproteobacteria bacterium]